MSSKRKTKFPHYSKEHIEEVEEICELRNLYDRPCCGCLYYGKGECAEVRKLVKEGIPDKETSNYFHKEI